MNESIIILVFSNMPTSFWNPPLAGSFIGVIGGFGVKYIYDLYKYNVDKNHYRRTIQDEIEQCIVDLKTQKKAIDEKLPSTLRDFLAEMKPGCSIGMSERLWSDLESFLSAYKTVLIPTDRWTSAKSIGALRFFTPDEIDMLVHLGLSQTAHPAASSGACSRRS